MNLSGKKILVVGLGKTGVETVRFLLKKGALVDASDITPFEKLPSIVTELKEMGVNIEAGEHRLETFLRADMIVLSPGAPFGLNSVKKAINKGVEVISEIELASRFIKKPMIGVTGSNGKTTTSTLIARILEGTGKRVFLGANIGTPLIQIADKDDSYDFLVLELSSFQLQGTHTFKPFIGMILNISPNHLDHHENIGEYIESKMRLFSNQTYSEWAIYNADDSLIKENLLRIRSKKIPFGETPFERGVFFDGANVRFRDESYDLTKMKLMGKHNIENAMASIACTRILECDPKLIQKTIVDFEPLPHRIEFIRELRGVRFYNDSKSTSPGATLRALESFSSPIILIAGGKDKGGGYEVLRETLRNRVKLLVLFGESKFRIEKELGKEVKTVLASSVDEATEKAFTDSEKGDTVLFSPACSSFDMFTSYEERGRRFKKIVQNF